MAESKEARFVRVKDRAGNEFYCPIDVLKDINTATEEILENCVDDGTAERYPGNFEVED